MKQKQRMKQNSKKIEMVILDSPKEGKCAQEELGHFRQIRRVLALKFT